MVPPGEHCRDSTCSGWSSERDARRGVHHGRVSLLRRARPRQGASARGHPRRAMLRAGRPGSSGPSDAGAAVIPTVRSGPGPRVRPISRRRRRAPVPGGAVRLRPSAWPSGPVRGASVPFQCLGPSLPTLRSQPRALSERGQGTDPLSSWQVFPRPVRRYG
jgi:hypothetical protein